MPKYYRFRATTPTRKPKRSKEKIKEKDVVERSKGQDGGWLDLTLACTPAFFWYLRRTSWRESPPLLGLPRQLTAMLRASLLNIRGCYVLHVLLESLISVHNPV